MPIKLLAFLALIVLVAVLTGFNLSNRCTIWFFHTYENVPVFAALVGAFVAGAIVSVPFVVAKKNRKIKQLKEKEEKPKKSGFFKSKKNKQKEGKDTLPAVKEEPVVADEQKPAENTESTETAAEES